MSLKPTNIPVSSKEGNKPTIPRKPSMIPSQTTKPKSLPQKAKIEEETNVFDDINEPVSPHKNVKFESPNNYDRKPKRWPHYRRIIICILIILVILFLDVFRVIFYLILSIIAYVYAGFLFLFPIILAASVQDGFFLFMWILPIAGLCIACCITICCVFCSNFCCKSLMSLGTTVCSIRVGIEFCLCNCCCCTTITFCCCCILLPCLWLIFPILPVLIEFGNVLSILICIVEIIYSLERLFMLWLMED